MNVLAETNRVEREQYVKAGKVAKSEQDTLDLSTILNIMDGIQSSNGRIITLQLTILRRLIQHFAAGSD